MTTTTNKPHRLTPQDQEGKPDAERIAYLVAPPTPYTRAQYRRAVRAKGGVAWTDLDLLTTARAGLVEIGGDNGALEILDAYREALEVRVEALIAARRQGQDLADVPQVDAELAAKANAATDVVRRHYPPFAEREADVEFFDAVSRIEATRVFVVGWENVDAACARDQGGLTDAALAHVPELHMAEIRAFVVDAETPSDAAGNGSASPSPGGCAPTSSPAARTTRKKRRGKRTAGS